MPIKRCEVCGAGFAQSRGRPSKRCPKCREGGGKYGGAHKKLRAATIDQAYGRPCARCRRPMLRGQELHLDHLDGGGPADYRGWAHAHCNTSAGASKGNRMRAPGGPSATRPEVVVIPPTYQPGSIRHRPDCSCGGSVVYEPGEWYTSRCW